MNSPTKTVARIGMDALSESRFGRDVSTAWYGKKLVTIGDSITWGHNPIDDSQITENWTKITAENLGMTFVNYGIDSTSLAINESNPREKTPVATRYLEMDDGADLVIVAGGSNDWMYSWTPVGDMESRTDYTFHGALHNICLGLLEKYPGKQILFLTPIKRNQDGSMPETKNAYSKTLKDYGSIIKQVCEYFSIPVLDMYAESQINPHIASQKAAFIDDGTHPNEAGHALMARRLTGYLKQLQ